MMKRLRRPRWLWRLIGGALCRWRGYWWSRCVNCGQEFGAWEWALDGYPTTGKSGWHYEEFALCRSCATCCSWRRGIRGNDAVVLSDYARRQRERWQNEDCKCCGWKAQWRNGDAEGEGPEDGQGHAPALHRAGDGDGRQDEEEGEGQAEEVKA